MWQWHRLASVESYCAQQQRRRRYRLLHARLNSSYTHCNTVTANVDSRQVKLESCSTQTQARDTYMYNHVCHVHPFLSNVTLLSHNCNTKSSNSTPESESLRILTNHCGSTRDVKETPSQFIVNQKRTEEGRLEGGGVVMKPHRSHKQ